MLSVILVNLGYFLMLCALLARDMLWLRSVLMVAQLALCGYASLNGVWNVAAWNSLFVLINGVRAWQIWRERRPLPLPTELQTVYDRRFSLLCPREFLALWQLGEPMPQGDTRLLNDGDRNQSLYCVAAGTAVISKSGQTVAELPTGSFIGEMSLLTGEPVSADVDVAASTTLQHWSADVLTMIKRRKPALWQQLQGIIGGDLVDKVRSASDNAATAITAATTTGTSAKHN